jgi:hypothetical protein
MAKTVTNFKTDILEELDDPNQTNYSDALIYSAINEAMREVVRTAVMVNKDYVQYALGESVQAYRVIRAVMDSGSVDYPADSGTAEAIDGGDANGLYDLNKQWIEDEWKDYTVAITGGTGSGQSRTVSSNTASTLTVSSDWTTEPDATSTYEIRTPVDRLYDATKVWPEDKYQGEYVRISSGTATGQERKIDQIAGSEIVVEEDWETTPVHNDGYQILGIQSDYSLPADFFIPIRARRNGDEMDRMDIGGNAPDVSQPGSEENAGWSVVSTNLRVKYCDGGDIIELYYVPTLTLVDEDTDTVTFGEEFYDAIKYYTEMVLKGYNYEDISREAAFYSKVERSVRKRMTDMNMTENMAVRSAWEEFEG